MNSPTFDRQETADRNLGFLLHDAARLMRVNYDRRMRDLGLTRSQWWVLTHLYFHQGITQSELSAILDVERATLGRLLDRLEQKGWVERRADPGDRRVKRVFLTGEVDDLMRQMRSRARDLRSEALAGLAGGDQEQLIETLLQVKENLARMLDRGETHRREVSNG